VKEDESRQLRELVLGGLWILVSSRILSVGMSARPSACIEVDLKSVNGDLGLVDATASGKLLGHATAEGPTRRRSGSCLRSCSKSDHGCMRLTYWEGLAR
jgi:hypothetical protein